MNTSGDEGGPEHFARGKGGLANLYFNRAVVAGSPDLYVAAVTRAGEALAPAVLISELSHPTADDQAVTMRTDGREAIFFSNRDGTLGLNDLWVSTRRSVRHPWSAPSNLGAPMNTAANEQQPSLSRDGRTLFFVSTRPGGLGGFDIWMSTRTPSWNDDADDSDDDNDHDDDDRRRCL